MRLARTLLLAALLAVAAGCASEVPPREPQPAAPELSRVSLVQEGMRPAEVRQLLGEPALTETPPDRPGAEVWHYDGGVVLFQDGLVAYRYASPKE
jgi:outer membrane protein assembly factor BamE (lipoprotein component of BamABCDE complex)